MNWRFYITPLVTIYWAVLGQEELFAYSVQIIDDQFQISFLKDDFVYTVQRIGVISKETKTALMCFQLYKTCLATKDCRAGKGFCFEINDRELVISRANFLRWRFASSDYFWGTECSLDDHHAGIYRIPLHIMKHISLEKAKSETRQDGDGRWGNIRNFFGGNSTIYGIAIQYSFAKYGGLSATASSPRDREWSRDFEGIYFDFIPMKDESQITFFVLFDKDRLKYSSDKKLRLDYSIIEMWECVKGCDDKSFKAGTFSGAENLIGNTWDTKLQKETKRGWIKTDISDPFYAFEISGDYYFVTLAGKLFVAPRASIDLKRAERLIADLDSDTFSTREKATRDLRVIGKPAQGALEANLPKSASSEQRRRIKQILDELKQLPNRETKLLWNDEKRPADKLLFDQDKKKVYAFTKPNRDQQVYFFEITDKPPQPRLFTGNIAPETPASVPPSTRLFLEYARFVRAMK